MVARRRNALVHAQALAFVGDVSLGNADVEIQLDAWQRYLNFRLLAAQFLDRLLQQLTIEVKTHGIDVSMLLSAQQVPSAPDLEVEGSNPESGAQVAEFADGGQPLARHVGEHLIGGNQQIGVGAPVRSSHASAQLVELRHAVKIGPVDDDGVHPGNVQPVLDNGGCDQDVELILDEAQHDALELTFRHLPVGNADARLRDEFLDHRCHGMNRFHAVVHEVNLAITGQLELDRGAHHVVAELEH